MIEPGLAGWMKEQLWTLTEKEIDSLITKLDDDE
jgi:hypothetical protein